MARLAYSFHSSAGGRALLAAYALELGLVGVLSLWAALALRRLQKGPPTKSADPGSGPSVRQGMPYAVSVGSILCTAFRVFLWPMGCCQHSLSGLQRLAARPAL